jgi:predicted RNA binding protein YcfA (HicA-like mRNA interferase family)
MNTAMEIRKVRRLLKAKGYTFDRQSKHEIWRHADGRLVSLPHSPNGPIRGQMLTRILKDMR